MRSNHRRLGAVALIAALLGVVSIQSASAVISTQAFCANIPTGQSGFTDIAQAAPHERNVECLKGSGITSGKTATTYAPTELVSRAQMATFIANMVDKANQLDAEGGTTIPDLPSAAAAGDHFTDDEETGGHEANINRLAEADIVSGQTDTTYNPTGNVSRAQMATFIAQALDFIRGGPLPEGPDRFTDDENTGGHEANINRLANADIIAGQTATTFNPTAFVSRAQMASFIIQAMADLHADGFINPLPASNQTITMSPSGPVTNDTDSVAGGEVAFTASNITVPDVDLALFPCENVFYGGGTVSFLDSSPNDSLADQGADLVEADIVAVNGTAQPADTEFVSGVAVTNGSITFTVDSATADCVHAVVWDDADDDNRLDLNDNDHPTERFGASNRVNFVPPAAASGAMDENVVSNDEAGNTFVGCELNQQLPGAGSQPEQASTTDCFTFAYDSDDVFLFDQDGDNAADDGDDADDDPDTHTLAEFEQALTPGDDIGGTYVVGGSSQFTLYDETPAPPGGLTGTVVSGHTVLLTFNEVAGADSYVAYARAVNPANPIPEAPAGCAEAAEYDYSNPVGSTSAAGDTDANTTNSISVTGLDIGSYCFTVHTIDQGDESADSSETREAVTATSSDPDDPEATDASIVHAGNNPRIDQGDEITICFNEAMAEPSEGDTITIQEPEDGPTATIVSGPNGTFSLAQDTECILIEINIPPLGDGAGTDGDPDMDTPATIIDASGISDANNNEWTPSDDPEDTANRDRVIDEEGA